jgi:putative addiction module component (TIGR02574 family)
MMSTTEILAQLPALTAADREMIRSQLDAIDSASPLSAEEQQLIQARVTAYRQNPGSAVSWSVAESEIRQQLGL